MRAMSSAMLAAITSPGIQPAFFVMATFATGPVYLWSGIGSIFWNGQTWLGVGTLGSISVAEEGSTVEAKGSYFGVCATQSFALEILAFARIDRKYLMVLAGHLSQQYHLADIVEQPCRKALFHHRLRTTLGAGDALGETRYGGREIGSGAF